MQLGVLARQASAGAIVGLSAVIYSISYGALLFSGPLAPYVGTGIAIALVTAVIGAAFGLLGQEKTFISGPDSNTISVLASMLVVFGSVGSGVGAGEDLSGPRLVQLALGMVFLTSLLSAVAFYVVAKAKLSSLVRYIPFSVMAGFLASTGWLMSSGALNIISGTPLTRDGFEKLLSNPAQPQLAFGLCVTAALFVLAPRVSSAVLIPLVMMLAALVVNGVLASGICTSGLCTAEAWMFPRMQDLVWVPPWQFAWSAADIPFFIEQLPGMLIVCFVGLLTILLSVASLELSYQKEFDLNKILKSHALTSILGAAAGGFLGLISIGRTTLNRQAGGGAVSGVVAAGICLAMLLGAGAAVAYLPKAALGGLVLYLGVGMLRQWLWDQRKTTSKVEFAQIFLILALVANYGFMVGFSAGLLISCIVFVISYSRIPLADLATTLSVFTSSVVRPEYEAETLRSHGDKTLLFRLSGYVFFGSASKIDAVFQTLSDSIEGVVVDFTNVSGIDSSAIAVFQRILRRYHGKTTRFYFVTSPDNDASVRLISNDAKVSDSIAYFPTLDHAVETAEEKILSAWENSGIHEDQFEFLDAAFRDVFKGYCDLRQIHKGELLCAEHEVSDAIFFIESGSLEVIKVVRGLPDLRLARLHKGAMVGELAFYTGEARTASIVADTDAAVYVLNKDALIRLRADHPDLATQFDHVVIGKLSRALARTNKLVAMFR